MRGCFEARDECRHGAGGELQQTNRVGWCLGPETLARSRPDLDLTFRDESRGKPADPADRAEQGNDGRKVVGAHVEQRAGTVPEEDVRIRVPCLLAAGQHRRRDRERRSDRAVVDQRSRLLIGAAEEDVGSAADPEPSRVGERE